MDTEKTHESGEKKKPRPKRYRRDWGVWFGEEGDGQYRRRRHRSRTEPELQSWDDITRASEEDR